MNTVPIGRITNADHVEPAGRGRGDRARAEVLDLDRVGERDHRLARAREHHRQREREQRGEPRRAWGGEPCGATADRARIRGWRRPSRSCSRSPATRSRSRTPRRCTSREAGITKLELVRLLPRGRRRRAARRRAPADDPQALRQRRRRPSRSTRSARRRSGRRSSTSRRSRFRRAATPTRSSSTTPRRSSASSTSAASSSTRTRCAPRTWTAPTSCASISIRCRAWRGRRSSRSRRSRARCSPSSGSSAGRRPAARAARTSGCGSSRAWPFAEVRRAALAFAREVERRAPEIATAQVVEGGAPRRVPRLQPERARSHDVQRVLGARDARRAGVDAADVGRLPRVRSARLHAAHRAGDATRRAATRTPRSTTHPGSLDALLALARDAEAADAPWPPIAKRGEAPRAVARSCR